MTITQDVVDLTVQPPPLSRGADIWWVPTEARTVGELVVRILLEYFLVQK